MLAIVALAVGGTGCTAAALGTGEDDAGDVEAARRPTDRAAGAAGWEAGDSADEALPPPGRGSLRQEEFTVSLRSGALLLKVTPLNESVIRLAAPDTYARLHALAESRRDRAARTAGTATIEPFLVSFFSYEPDATFRPEDLQMEHQGRLLRALAIVPITPGWGRQRLRQQETQSAVYGFDAAIDLGLPLVVRYGTRRSDAWNRIIPRLESESRRVRSGSGP